MAAVHTRAIGGRLMTFNEAWRSSLSCHDLSPKLGTREFANRGVQSASPANSGPVSTEIAVREHMVRDIKHLLATDARRRENRGIDSREIRDREPCKLT